MNVRAIATPVRRTFILLTFLAAPPLAVWLWHPTKVVRETFLLVGAIALLAAVTVNGISEIRKERSQPPYTTTDWLNRRPKPFNRLQFGLLFTSLVFQIASLSLRLMKHS